MASNNVAGLAPVRINSTVLPVEGLSISPGIVANLAEHSGQAYATADLVTGGQPRISFRAPFAAANALIGRTILRATVLDAFLTKYDQAGYLASTGSDHPKLSLEANCVAAIHITGASAAQDGRLMADIECFPISGPGTVPMAWGAAALPTLAAIPDHHTIGPISRNGTVRPGLESFTIDYGQQLIIRRTDGAGFPTAALRTGARPIIRVQHSDPPTINSILGLVGIDGGTGVVVYARKLVGTNGQFQLSTGADAISFTVAKASIRPLDTAAEQGAHATVGFEVACMSADGSTHPIVISTSATAPALP